MRYRKQLRKSDLPVLKKILASTGFFYDSEVEMALELAQENWENGEEKSGYIFIIAEKDDMPVAFACYGKTPCTESSFDLYWIAVNQSLKGQGIGKILMKMVSDDIANLGGKNIWIETSGRPLYEPTRQFYLKYGCKLVAQMPEFYGLNDDKVVYLLKV